jgi:hypothetical protein
VAKYVYVIVEAWVNNESVEKSVKRVCTDFEFAKSLKRRLEENSARNQFYFLNGYELDERTG